MECSQLLGAFHCRSDKLSSSVVAQPLEKTTVNTVSASNKTWLFEKPFIPPNLVHDLIPFKDLILFPFRNYVGNRAIWFHARDLHLRHQLTVAIDEHLGIWKQTLIRSNVQHDKVILWVDRDDFALRSDRQRNFEIRNLIFIQLGLELASFSRERFVFSRNRNAFSSELFVGFKCVTNLFNWNPQCRPLIQFLLRPIPFLGHSNQIRRSFISALLLNV